ncbi:MAG TPA: PP2C family protein-serine/threonine phosphatase [Ignavibacteriales bacterium]|nr:PP2C family protein-serine/threonine phosphatase [Ignavibacteriales bacterium]
MAKWRALNRIYEIYTSDLSMKDVEKLIKRDAPEVYDFYVRRMKMPEDSRNSIERTFLFLRNLFIEFLLKMSPARRLFYSLALVFFLVGLLGGLWNWAVLGFFMVNLLIAFELADKLTAKDELAVAREIQTALMPRHAPENSMFDIACYSEPAREVGGDYYDFICPESQKDKMYIVIGDISGKGMGAALYMVQVQAILKYISNTCVSPKAILSELNKSLQNILKSDSFFTVSMASLEKDRCEISLSRAGHTPLIHYRAGKAENVTPVGLGVGLRDGGIFDKVLEEMVITTEPGDVLVFYTDGLTEAMDRNRNFFGEERLMKVIEKNAHLSASLIQENIIKELDRFRDSTIPGDDTTLVIMKRSSSAGKSGAVLI